MGQIINYYSLGVTFKLYPRRRLEISLRICVFCVCCRDNRTTMQVVDARVTETTNCKPTRTETSHNTDERPFVEWTTTTGVMIAADNGLYCLQQ